MAIVYKCYICKPHQCKLLVYIHLLRYYVVHVQQIVLHHCNIHSPTKLVIHLNPPYIKYNISLNFTCFYYRSVTTFPQLLPPSVSLTPSVSSPYPFSAQLYFSYFKLAKPHLLLKPTPPSHAAPISPTNRGVKY